MNKNRRSVRLRGYDYSAAGLYFVTIVCQNRINWFGEISNGRMTLSEAGKIAKEEWSHNPDHPQQQWVPNQKPWAQ